LLCCCLLASLIPRTTWAEPPHLIRIGAFNFYPGIFQDTDGVIKGFFVDTLAEVARRENLRIEYVYGSWDEGLKRIQSGEIDLLTSVAYTPERAKFLDYAKTPLLTVWGELYVPVDSDIDNITKMQTKRVAVMKNDFNGRSFIKLAKSFGITCEYVEVEGFEDVFQAVAEKTVDAGVVNSTFGVPKHKEFKLRSTGIVFNPFDIYFAVAKNKNTALLNLLDDYLKKWRIQEGSVYLKAREHWAHGMVEKVHVIPRWLLLTVAALGSLTLLAAAFIVLLRRQVARTTHAIVQRETSLRESTEMIRLLLDSTEEAIYGLDLQGICTFCNAACVRILGYEHAEQIVGKNMHELIHYALSDGSPIDAKDCVILQSAGDAKGSHSHDEVFWRANRTSFPVEYWGHPIRRDNKVLGTVVTFVDITDRKQLEDSYVFLSQSGYQNPGENFFEGLARHLAENLSLDCVCIYRLKGDGRLANTEAIYHDGELKNNTVYALEGTPCGEVLSQTIRCYPQGVRHLFPQASLLQELQAESYIGATLWSFDGQPIGLITGLSRNPLVNVQQAESILKLVSLRTSSELERTQAVEELLQKNMEIERFTYAVSHDLKSPLVTIKTFLGYLQQDLVDANPEAIEKDIGFMRMATEKMTFLLDELLRMSRVGRIVSAPVHVSYNLLMEEVLTTVAGAILDRGVEIQVTEEPIVLHGDRSRLAEIWQNLVDNAVKYMGDQPTPRIEIGVHTKAKEPIFYVRDNGMGIDPRHSHKIFGLFDKLDPRTEGAGLGLALVKRIVELYKGRIWVESEGHGLGSCFQFTLPEAFNPQGEKKV
jgi:PAS domain S-box-containing protein